MPVCTGGVLIEASGLPHHLSLLRQAEYCGSRRRLLWGGVSSILGGDPGVLGVPHHSNVVVDAVVRHWILLVAVVTVGHYSWGGGGASPRRLFYVDNGLVALTDPVFFLGGV